MNRTILYYWKSIQKLFVNIVGVTLVTLFFIVSSCHTKSRSSKCPDNIICTEVYVSVSVHIVDSLGNDQLLDSAYVTRVSTSEIIKSTPSVAGSYYLILEDSYRAKLQNSKDTFLFTGIKNGHVVVREPYVINADCCHINLISGKTEVTIY